MPDAGWTFETLRIHFEELLKASAVTSESNTHRLEVIDTNQQAVLRTMLTKAEYEMHHQELVNKFLVVEGRLLTLETEYSTRKGMTDTQRGQRNIMLSIFALLLTSMIGIATNLYIHEHEVQPQPNVLQQRGTLDKKWQWPQNEWPWTLGSK